MADEVHRLQSQQGAECELFRVIAEQGHYAGRTRPTNTRQGIYAAAPSGVLLASINTRSADQVVAMLERALERWQEVSLEERALDDATIEQLRKTERWERRYPQGGLILRIDSRDLPREADGWPRGWSGDSRNRDFVWFRAEEAASIVPESAEPGAQRNWPRRLVERIATLHLVDNVRGQVTAFASRDLQDASIGSTVVRIDGDLVFLNIEGHTHVATGGTWSVRGFDDLGNPSEQHRGVRTKLLGRAVYDVEQRRFREFALTALGVRWGGTQYNGRGDDLHPNGIGFAFTLAESHERIPPAFAWRYGW